MGCNYFPIGNSDVLPWKAADGNYVPLDVCIYCGAVSVLSAWGGAGALLNGLADTLTRRRSRRTGGCFLGKHMNVSTRQDRQGQEPPPGLVFRVQSRVSSGGKAKNRSEEQKV